MSESPKRRRQLVGFVLSGLFPGLGQLYNREYLKGVLFIVPSAVLTWFISPALPTNLLALAQPSGTLMLLIAVLLAIWLWTIVNAWKVAGR